VREILLNFQFLNLVHFSSFSRDEKSTYKKYVLRKILNQKNFTKSYVQQHTF
jgi:hypothetical protein